MEVILFFVLVYAAKKAWDDSKKGAAKSRQAYMARAAAKHPGMPRSRQVAHAVRHDAGHALSQLLRGFPNARHGFAAGWHEGRQAHAHARAEHQRAKAEHLETRASLIPDLAAYRARQKAALEQIRRGAGPDVKAAACKHAPGPCLAPASCPCDCPDCMAAFSRQWEPPEEGSEGSEGRQPTRRADGRPETDADRRFLDLRESGYDGPIDRDGNIPDPSDPEPEAAEASQSPSTTEGTTMASEVTYDGVIRSVRLATGAAEERAAEIDRQIAAAEHQAAEVGVAQRWADNTAEQMQALRVDSIVLGAMADHQDALSAAEKAHQSVLEGLEQAKKEQARIIDTAKNVESLLVQGHQGLADAHREAPRGAADREFYEEG